jgi:threonyl-tRNA synthetase
MVGVGGSIPLVPTNLLGWIMPIITLPDGTQKTFPAALTVLQVADSIGAGLARAALAGKVNDRLVDLDYLIEADANVSIITEKNAEGLDIIRHSCAHLLAQAAKQLFPSIQVTIGPVIEDGFYYDFAYEKAFTPDDLERLEARMTELAAADLPVKRISMTREEALAFFENIGEHYKAEIIRDIPESEHLNFYTQGDFTDLCRGPHVPRTGCLKAFKLTKVAGAYWRGDSNNAMLQRIYATAWADKKALAEYLHRLDEAEKRDHRRIAKTQDLFHLQEEAPGMVFWHHKGLTIYHIMQDYIRGKLREQNYIEVRTPTLVDVSLWQRSGHLEKFGNEMFFTETENRQYAVKPMSCPCHVMIFNQGLTSYRELPIRMAEFGSCHRCEPSGSMHGLMRVRHFVQDDAHIFCTEAQIQDEIANFNQLLFDVYRDFGFNEVILRLSTRPEKRVGSDELWDKAEHALEQALNATGRDWDLLPGEGAFYGPKIEFSLKDCVGRVWQCGTIQVDFSMPGRLDASYIAEDGSKQVPVMVHRAILGTFERFMGILIEHYAGHWPVWLAPEQVAVLTITERHNDWAQELVKELRDRGFRAISDLRNEKIGFKIRAHTLQRVPYLVVLGDREVETKQLSVRTRSGEDRGSMSLAEFTELLSADCARLGRVAD